MTIDYFRRLFSYTEWANGRMLECARGLSEEQFTRPIVSSFPTVRETLAHIALGEWVWLQRWKGVNPTARPAWAQGATLESIEEQFQAIQHERAEFLETLTDEALGRDVAYRTFAGDPLTNGLGDLMAHLVNHGTYHRGQLTTMMRQVGAVPPATDFVSVYLQTLK
jgi:uncharacterized damage-inducible protein DinB